MYQLNELRVPGLGLAAAIPDELMTQPRFDPRVDGSEQTTSNHRVFGLFRTNARDRDSAARAKPLAAASPGKDLARA